MAKVNEQDLAFGAVYATAIREVAETGGLTDALLNELLDLVAYLDTQPQFASFLSSPTVDTEARGKLIEKLFRGKYSDLFVDTLGVMNDKDRLGLLPALAESYRLLHEERGGRVEVSVRTAHPLTDDLRARLRDVAAKRTGRQVDLVEKLDHALLGGLVVQIEDNKFDMSVDTRLKKMFRALLDRASHEIHSGRRYFEAAPT